MHPHPVDRAALALALLLFPAGAFALDLDRFTSALPPNPCLPLSAQPVVFAGTFCDGAACPPDPWATCESAEVTQVGLAGVLAGTQRHVRLFQLFNDANNLSVRIDPDAQRLHATFDAPTEAGLIVNYGSPYLSEPDPDALNLDLVSLGVESVCFELAGNFTPAQPLFVVVELLSDAYTYPRPSGTAQLTVSQAGAAIIPLAAFQPQLGFSPSDVDDIELWFSQCTSYETPCTGVAYDPVQFSLGPIVFHQGVVPASRTSWGRLKTIYR